MTGLGLRRPEDASWTTWRARRELPDTPVVVLHGGTSSEREVSLASGTAILDALRALPEGEGPGSIRAVEILEEGTWEVGGKPLAPHEAVSSLEPGSLFLLALHGGAGEDGRIQAFLEVCGRRYTGSGPSASAVCMDKRRTREAARAVGVRVAPGRLATPGAGPLYRPGENCWFVKPNRGGSSVGVERVTDPDELQAAVERVQRTGDEALVEVEQPGLEVTSGIIGNSADELVALPVVEVVPKKGRFFDYEEKYTDDGAEEICPPAQLSEASWNRVQEHAARLYRAAGCEGYARVDFIVPPGGITGDEEPILLEVNTLPGFTPRSILPQAAGVTGVSYSELCLEVCARAISRFQDHAGTRI